MKLALIRVAVIFGFWYFVQFAALDFAMATQPRFRRWAAPKLHAFEISRKASSAAITLFFFCLGLRMSDKERRREGWKFPGKMRGLDRLMRKALLDGKFKDATFLGV